MNNTVIGIILAVIVVGGGVYVFTNSGGSSEEGNQNETQQQAQTPNGTFADIFASGESVECTFEHDDGTNVSSGTVYMTDNGNRIRGDFTIEEGTGTDGPMEAHMIRVDGTNYVWGSFYEQGIKMEVTAEERDQLFPEDDAAAVDANTQYNCDSWSVDESRFALPSDVEFVDMQTQFQQSVEISGGASGDMKAQQCAACEQLEGSAQQQCLQALGCS